MRAVVCTDYGPPDVLKLRDVPKPVPKDGEVLIRIRATTVSAADCELRRFDFAPWIWVPIRLAFGIRRPRQPVLGQELAGDVESLGAGVRSFAKGDRVFAATGIGLGAWRVLVNGAGGSFGSFAVQLAKVLGAHVTAVDSAPKLEMLRTIGADRVIDYSQEDFTASPETYDVIFDVVRGTPSARMVRSLAENGWLLMANPGFLQIVRAKWASKGSRKRVSFSAIEPDGRGPRVPARPGRSGTAAPGHRPALSARADGRGAQVRRDRPEAGEHRGPRRIAAAAIAVLPSVPTAR